jgi:uncharacterized protein
LSGFVTLLSYKRDIDENHVIVDIDSNRWGNMTISDLLQDAKKALAVLIQQPEVDSNKIT